MKTGQSFLAGLANVDTQSRDLFGKTLWIARQHSKSSC